MFEQAFKREGDHMISESPDENREFGNSRNFKALLHDIKYKYTYHLTGINTPIPQVRLNFTNCLYLRGYNLTK